MISTKYRNAVSFNGYPRDELSSGMQKYVRRAKTDKALFCAIELDLFVHAKGGERIRTNLIHRLMVMALEEVSLANTYAVEIVDGYTSVLLERNISVEDRRTAVCQIVSILANSNHTRVISHTNAAITQKDAVTEEIVRKCYPHIQQVYDNHAKKECNAPKTSFVLTKCELEYEVLIDDFIVALEHRDIFALKYAKDIVTTITKAGPRRKRTKPAYLIFDILEDVVCEDFTSTVRMMRRWYTELSPLKEDYMTYAYVILLHTWQHMLPEYCESDIAYTQNTSFADLYERHLASDVGIFSFDDYVIDMHTKRGKKTHDTVDFALVGSQVANETFVCSPSYSLLYEDVKIAKVIGMYNFFEWHDHHDGELRNLDLYRKPQYHKSCDTFAESDVFSFEVRAQLLTARNRQDVYFARLRSSGKRVFVKGPYLTEKEALETVFLAKVKHIFAHIRVVEVRMVYLMPDLLKTPLGVRSKVRPGEVYPFLIFDCLCAQDEPLPTTTKSSKMWPPTEVVDWSKTNSVVNPLELKGEMLRSYVINVMYRYVMGIPDFADRNFVLTCEDVISVDEGAMMRKFTLEKALRGRAKVDLVLSYLPKLADVRKQWRSVLPELKVFNAKLAAFASDRLGELH